ncbi:hypothetical protein C6P44_001623 [Monosporozyma unispora]|nr:hypothetical protein C6P44_001623 [Kazachstania unispora]
MLIVGRLQKDVLHSYRLWIRMIYQKPIENRPHFLNYVHTEFNKYKDLKRKDFTTIEYLLRMGKRRLQMFSQSDVKDIH